MMNMEYIAEGPEPCPLIRLYGYESADIAALRDICIALSQGRIQECKLESQPWVRALGGCRLTLRASKANRGVRSVGAGEPFVMEYTKDGEGWLEVADKLEPFLRETDGFQWLTMEGDVSVLISKTGEW